MAKKFGSSLSNAEFALARAFEKAGLTSISQAVKAFERGETDRIAAWKAQLESKNEEKKTSPLTVNSGEHIIKIEVTEDIRDLAEIDAYERRYQD